MALSPAQFFLEPNHFFLGLASDIGGGIKRSKGHWRRNSEEVERA